MTRQAKIEKFKELVVDSISRLDQDYVRPTLGAYCRGKSYCQLFKRARYFGITINVERRKLNLHLWNDQNRGIRLWLEDQNKTGQVGFGDGARSCIVNNRHDDRGHVWDVVRQFDIESATDDGLRNAAQLVANDYLKMVHWLAEQGIALDEPIVEHIPSVQEIRQSLDGLPKAIRVEAEQFNVFDVLDVARMEIRHSNVLGWLLNAAAEHGMAAEIIRALLSRAGAARLADSVDLNSFVVKREWNHIDVLLKSEKEQMVIAIENKIGASEGFRNGESQLARYGNRIDNAFPNWNLSGTGRKILVYLTPDGTPPSDGNEDWQIVTYEELISDVEGAYNARRQLAPMEPKVAQLIEQYLTTIKRNVLMKIDSKLQAECRRYYAENKKVLDFIFDYGKMGLKGDVDETLTSLAARGVVEQGDISHKSEDGELDFTLPALDRYLCKNGVRAYRCFVDGAWAGSGQVCAVMSLRLSGDEAMDDLTMRFRERMIGEPWETNRQGELKPLMNLPWYGKNGRSGKKNWKAFSLSQDGEPLSSAVEAAVREFVVKGAPKILKCLSEVKATREDR